MKMSARDVVLLNTEVKSLLLSRPERRKNKLYWLSGVLLVLSSLVPAYQTARAEEAQPQPITSESIKQNYPEVYKKIQQEEKYQEPVNPDKPYGDDGGFWALPKFKPDQPQNWWERSSFEYTPEYPYFLKKITTQLSYLTMRGSSDGSIAAGSFALYLRKGRISNTNSYSIDQKYVVHESGFISLDRDMQTFEETLRYELNRHLFFEAGMFWRRISTINIRDRFLPFIGIGTYNILDTIGVKSKKDLLGLEVGFAQVYDTYYPTVYNLTNNKYESFKAVYLKADYTHIFNDSFTYRMNFLYKNALDKTPVYVTSPNFTSATIQHFNLRYDWRWSNSLEYNYNRFIGAYISYDIVYDSNPWPTVAKQDTLLLTSLRLSYW